MKRGCSPSASFRAGGRTFRYFPLQALETAGRIDLGTVPYSIRVLLENLLRHGDGDPDTAERIRSLLDGGAASKTVPEIPFFPSRVLMQDFTGVPAIVDLASLRDAVKAKGGDPALVNPVIPVDLVIDHSVQIDTAGCGDAFAENVAREFERNSERYRFLKWAQKTFDRLSVFPPGSGIIHQVNLEYLSRVVGHERREGEWIAFPDTVVGSDSHTAMINGLGVLGWGVGGIEAEAALLGQPLSIKVPEVIGIRLTGELPAEASAYDLALTLVQRLRRENVVEKFVEFIGPGAARFSVPDRATVANMAPEYGATVAFFPVDDRVLDFLRLTGRGELVETVERYCRRQKLFLDPSKTPVYSRLLTIDLAAIGTSLAGPTRPQEHLGLKELKSSFCRGDRLDEREKAGRRDSGISVAGSPIPVADGSLVLASITSCTSTANPALLTAAGLVAQKAVALGMRAAPHVKTSFAAGSRVSAASLERSGLMSSLESLGFHLAALGCATCIGNSGPLSPALEQAIMDHDLVVAAVLSGNRNFEGRIHRRIRCNYLASPALVVALAIAGRIDIDLATEPLGLTSEGLPVYWRDLCPTPRQVDATVKMSLTPDLFVEAYGDILTGNDAWRDMSVPGGETFAWQTDSTYIRPVPFFQASEPADINGARVLLWLGDSVTTDHISPAGSIAPDSPAGLYLRAKGVAPADFNQYGSRRGNHEVMERGAFSSPRIRNRLVHPLEGGMTMKFPERETMTVFSAAERYGRQNVPLIILAGKEYGSGSSRDWAAKGPLLLGVKAVIAGSFERIHRGNLIGMGILPLQFRTGESPSTLGLDGSEAFHMAGISRLEPGGTLEVAANHSDGRRIRFSVQVRLDTLSEVRCFRSGGLLPQVLDQILCGRKKTAPSV
jgi:aconitate hydratase